MGNAASGAHAFSRQRSTTDIEMQRRKTNTRYPGKDCHDILAVLFGLSEEQLQQYPGAMAYCQYLETCFKSLLAEEYSLMWGALEKPIPKAAAECWELVDAITSQAPAMDGESSIDDICSTLLQPKSAQHGTREPCLVAIFSVLCWTTMSLTPELRWADFERSSGQPSLMIRHQSITPNSLRIDNVARPIGAIFRQFHRAMPVTGWRHRIGEPGANDTSAALDVSCLNYACLKDIAKIRLLWVEDLASHLDFDVAERTLSIFRFPTFCAMSIHGCRQADKHEPFAVMLQKGPIRALYSESTEAAADAPYGFEQLHREVLMSYRLLFGQTRGSQRLAKAALDGLRANTGGQYDQLLDILCTHSHYRIRNLPSFLWPVTCRSFEGFLQEQSSYSAQDDFPLYGQRLAKLQRFNLRQQPSRLWDLWRDRRNPLQWYTFWAVLVLGGISSLLTLAQLVVAIVQVTRS